MKIGFVELDDTIVVPKEVQTEKPGSINIVLEIAGSYGLAEGERILLEGEGSFSIRECWFSNSQAFRLEPAAGRFRLTDRRLCIVRPVTRSATPMYTERNVIRHILIKDAIQSGRSEYVEISQDELRGYIGNRLLISSGDEDFQLEMDTPEGPGPIVSNIPRIKRYTEADVKEHRPQVKTLRHKQIGAIKYDIAAAVLLILAGFFSLAWTTEGGLVEARILSVVLLAPAVVVIAYRLRIPHRLRVGPDGVTLISYLGSRRLPFSGIERFMSDTEYAEEYKRYPGGRSVMVTKEYPGIRISLKGGKEIFVAASSIDARLAGSYFLGVAPADTQRAIAGAEAIEADRRSLQEMADRLPKKIMTANNINSISAAAMFIFVVWIAVQILPDVNVRNEPETIQSKILFGCIIGAICFGFEAITFGYFYGPHVKFQVERLIGKIGAFNDRVGAARFEVDLIAIKRLQRLTWRTGLAGIVLIGVIMLITALLSLWNPSVNPITTLSFALSGAGMVSFGVYMLYKI